MRKNVNESDWVGLRALYLLLATDTSSVCSPEVQRIKNFYERRYGMLVYKAMEQLSKDNAIRETFTAPDVMWARTLRKRINVDPTEDHIPENVEEIKL